MWESLQQNFSLRPFLEIFLLAPTTFHWLTWKLSAIEDQAQTCMSGNCFAWFPGIFWKCQGSVNIQAIPSFPQKFFIYSEELCLMDFSYGPCPELSLLALWPSFLFDWPENLSQTSDLKICIYFILSSCLKNPIFSLKAPCESLCNQIFFLHTISRHFPSCPSPLSLTYKKTSCNGGSSSNMHVRKSFWLIDFQGLLGKY